MTEHGIAVIFDVVYNHLGPNDLSIWQFDGWSLMQWINQEMKQNQPWKISIAEDMQMNEALTSHRNDGESPSHTTSHAIPAGGKSDGIMIRRLVDFTHGCRIKMIFLFFVGHGLFRFGNGCRI